MLKVTGLDQFKSATSAWLGEVRKATSEAAVGLAKRTFEKILYTSPQWSGDFVNSWNVSYGTPQYYFEGGAFPGHQYPGGDPFQRGASEPIRAALQRAQWKSVTLGTSIYITNAAHHGEDSYGWRIEDGSIKLRPVNAGATHVIARSVAFMLSRYKVITPSKLSTLRRY